MQDIVVPVTKLVTADCCGGKVAYPNFHPLSKSVLVDSALRGLGASHVMLLEGEVDCISSLSEMDTNHSTNNESGIIWYLDSNSDNEDTKDESTESTCARQPWRSYWPPKCQKTTEMWLRSEFPEVLSWRFDRTRPFDRPWRTWNRSARAMEEHGVGFQSQLLVERYRQRKGRNLHFRLPWIRTCY